MKITIPEYVKAVMARLDSAGFDCFIVGGCVRDALLDKEPHDYDLTTSATPDEMLDALKGEKVVKTGLKHGTLTVISEGRPLEVTSFRTDGKYLDHRRPESVRFSRQIEDDLSRRDLTVNAMAYSERRGLVDLFGGENDLKNKVICAVGEPDRRVSEDALRIVRTLRFSATLGFGIEKKTAESLRKNRELLKSIAVERIQSEFSKLICGKGATAVLREFYDVVGVFIPELLDCVGFEQHSKYHDSDVFGHTLRVIDGCDENDLSLRLAALLHDIAKPACFSLDGDGVGHFYGHAETGAKLCGEILSRLRVDNRTKDEVTRLVLEHCMQIPKTDKGIRRFLAGHTERETLLFAALGRADREACADGYNDGSEYSEFLKAAGRIRAEGACLSLRSLEVNGQDLVSLGFSGAEIGKRLEYLLDRVLDGDLENKREALLSALPEYDKHF